MKNRFSVALVAALALAGVFAALPRGAPTSVQPVSAQMRYRIYFAATGRNVDFRNLPAAPQATAVPTATPRQRQYSTGLLGQEELECAGRTNTYWVLRNCDGRRHTVLHCPDSICGPLMGKWVEVGYDYHSDCFTFAALNVMVATEKQNPCDATPTPVASPTATLYAPASAPPPQVTPPNDTPTPDVPTPGTPQVTPVSTDEPFVVAMPCTGAMMAEFARLIHIEANHLVQTGKTKIGDSADVARDGCKVNLEEGPWNGIHLPEELQGTLRFDFEGEPVVAYYGEDDLVFDNVLGGTFRFRPFYVANGDVTNWEEDPCRLMSHEEDFGQDNAFPYHTIDGNVGCITYPRTLITVAGCPTTAAEATSLLGGRDDDWSNLGFTSGRLYFAWKFDAKGRTGTNLKWPGWGNFDHWKWGMAVRGPLPPAGSRPEEYVDEATFNCH